MNSSPVPKGTENSKIIIKLKGITDIIKKNLRLPNLFLYLLRSDNLERRSNYSKIESKHENCKGLIR